MRTRIPLWVAIFSLALLMSSPCTGADLLDKEPQRPAHWAKPIHLTGAPNLHKVSDTLYRSAQPTRAGMANLKAMGIKAVVNLRSYHSDRDEIGSTPLMYEEIPMTAYRPSEEEAVMFLKIAADPQKAPVLVHCQHGADRTGTMCAIYRVAVMGWTKEEAIKEMTEGGFGFHEIWVNLVPWIKALDIEKIKKEAGITTLTLTDSASGDD